MNPKSPNSLFNDLINTIYHLNNPQDLANFFKDLCTPAEINAISERWRVCELLNQGDKSYREINKITGASLTTIGRVARFLKDENYGGYRKALEVMKNE